MAMAGFCKVKRKESVECFDSVSGQTVRICEWLRAMLSEMFRILGIFFLFLLINLCVCSWDTAGRV